MADSSEKEETKEVVVDMNSCERTKEKSPTAIKNKSYSPIKKLNKIEAVPDYTKNLEGGEAEYR